MERTFKHSGRKAFSFSKTPKTFKRLKGGDEGAFFLEALKQDRLAIGALALMLALMVAAMVGRFTITEITYFDLSRMNQRPSFQFWLGTDMRGRDLFQRLILAFGNSVEAAILASLISTFAGTALGLLGGYFGGILDRLVLWVIDFVGMAPTLVLILILFSLFHAPNRFQIAFIIAIFSWIQTARFVRTKTILEKEMEYVHASLTVGTSKWNILFQQILPQMKPLVIAAFFLNVGLSLGVETGISYLGFGFPYSVPSIGGLIASGGNLGVLLNRPWVWMPASISVFLFMLCAHYVGQFLIRLADPGALE